MGYLGFSGYFQTYFSGNAAILKKNLKVSLLKICNIFLNSFFSDSLYVSLILLHLSFDPSFFFFPNLTCITQQYQTLNTFIFYCLLIISVCYLCCATYRSIRTLPYVPFFFCRRWCISMLHHFIFSVAVDTLSFIFFFLKYPLSICCSSGPFSPQGSLKLHLVTSTPTLTFFPPPPRLIFLQTLPEVFLPRGSSFLTASLHCGVSILSLAQRKQYRRMEGRRLLRDLLWHSDADGLPPKKTLCFQLFIFSLWTLLCLHGECREGDLRDLKW